MHPSVLELETIERNAWEDLARIMPSDLALSLGLEAGPIGGAFFFMASKLPLFQFNWLAGAGLGPDDGACIAEGVRRFRAAGQSKFIIQIPPGPNAERIAALARDQGLSPSPLAWAKFCCATNAPPRAETSFEIRELGAADGDIFADTAIAGFGMPKPMAAWLRQIAGRPHWHVYASFERGAPAGAGALYVDGDFAWVGIGATRPEMREKGGQSALLARRIADAAGYGAKFAVTETGVPQEGQSSPSYNNILRSGFTIAYVRPNWTQA